MHHCVGTYVDRVARGETNIFFIRKEKEPGQAIFHNGMERQRYRTVPRIPKLRNDTGSKSFYRGFQKENDWKLLKRNKDKGLRRCG